MYIGFQMSLGLPLLSLVGHHNPMLLILNLGVSNISYQFISVLGVETPCLFHAFSLN